MSHLHPDLARLGTNMNTPSGDSATLLATAAFSTPGLTRAVRVGGRLEWDGVSSRPGSGALLLFAGVRLAALLENHACPSDWRERLSATHPAIRVEDFGHALCVPALVEGHTHLFLSPEKPTDDPMSHEALRAAAVHHVADYRRAGVAWVRDCGDPLNANIHARDATRENGVAVRASGAAIHRVKRYGKQLGHAVADEAEFLQAVRARVAAGVDDVKLILSGIVNFERAEVKGEPQFSTAAVREAVRIAHDNGRKVIAHTSGDKAVALAAETGVDTVEHAYFVSEETLKKMADAGTVWLPTLAPVHVQWRDALVYGHAPETVANLRRILDGHARSIVRGAELGVRLAGGSDAGSPGVLHGPGAVLEFELLAGTGLDPTLAYAAASTPGATNLGFKTDGRLEVGSCADFVIVSENPAANPSTFRNVLAVLH